MHEEIKLALKQAIVKTLPLLQELEGEFSEPYLVWNKRGEGQWQSEYQERPNLLPVYSRVDKQIEENSKEFGNLFFKEYPEYQKLVGFVRFGLHRLDHSHILRSAISHLWDRYGTFNCNEASVAKIVEEFEEFLNQPTVRFRFQAQLLNYHMTASSLALSDNLSIRRLSEEEVSTFHGGPITMVGFIRSRTIGIHEFVIEGEDEALKIFGDFPDQAVTAPDNLKNRLDRAILCLRTFKEGRIGYDYVHFKPIKFCPLSMASLGYGDLYVPFGSYRIADDEIHSLCEYAALVFGISEPAMEMACMRLADAETRMRPQDQIVDAVIGMEAVLLAGLDIDARRGELKYRFSIHYASLFNSSEDRYSAFRVAKDLYDLRSAIAHGSNLKSESVRVGEDRMELAVAAKRAKESLRTVIRRFLPEYKAAPYKKPEFWERAYFGL